MKKTLVLLTITLFYLTLFATDIFINNVKIDSSQMPNLEIKKCSVKFDAKGNVYINAPDIKLVQEDSAPVQKKYFLTISLNPATKNNLTIFINGTKAFEIKGGTTNFLEKVSSFLHKGDNTILIVGKPQTTKTTLNLIFGTGKEEGGKLELTPIENKTVNYDKNGLSLTFSAKVE